MSFDVSLRNHLINISFVGSNVFQALIINEETDRDKYFPNVVFELEEEKRDVKTDRVNATYWICISSEQLSEAQSIENDIYNELKDFNGKLDNSFPCSMNFIEHKRKYNRDLSYWIVYSKYNVSYKK